MSDSEGAEMPEGGPSPAEVDKEVAGQAEHPDEDPSSSIRRRRRFEDDAQNDHDGRREWLVTGIEAVLMVVLAVLAVYAGYSSARWSTDSRLKLSQASTAHTQSSSDALASSTRESVDSATFTAWFEAWVAGDPQKELAAELRFSPNFRLAFVAWMATDPLTNPNAPAGPTSMPEYKQPLAASAAVFNTKADRLYQEGANDGTNSDNWLRIALALAAVLFLFTIKGHHARRTVRIGLIVVGAVLLLILGVDLATLPVPPA
jgi:hypothetical protein